MSTVIQQDLRSFATELIELNGGLVDWPPEADHGQAMLPDELSSSHGGEEVLPLSVQPGGKGLCVNLASDFLDTCQRWLETVPRVSALGSSDAYLKRGDISEAVGRAFTWLNAKVRVTANEPSRCTYDTWWFHALLASEDRWESQMRATVNAAAGVEVDFPDPLKLWELEPREEDEPAPPQSYKVAVAVVSSGLQFLAADFLARMDRRLERDRRRLKDYYNALRRETKQKRERSRTPVDPQRAESADRAVTLELRRKLAELEERYAIDVALTPLILVRTELPVLEVTLLVHRKQATREHTIYWNPVTKAFDPLPCSSCGQGAFSLAFTNDRVEPLCASCAR